MVQQPHERPISAEEPSSSGVLRVSRRRFAVAAALGAPAFLRQPVGAAGERVIVIGAGIAGIAAAVDLQAAGLDVVVLEARNRIGGRIWTDHRWGFPLDLGASWIHGSAPANPIWQLRNELGLRTVPTDWDDLAVYDVDGKLISTSQSTTDAARYRSAYRKARRWGNRQESDNALHDGIDFALRTRAMSPYDQRALDFRLSFEVEQDYGGDAGSLSNWWYDQDSWLGGRQDSYMIDGYGELVETLADNLDIRLNTIVSSVTYGSFGVRIATNRGVQQAAYAVCTVPLGVLKADRITFNPALTRGKRAAISRLGVGTLNKLYLGFRERFWDDREAIGYQSTNRGEWSLWMDLEHIVGEPILLAFNAATFGKEVESFSDQETLDAAMDVLRTIYGRSIPDPQAAMITRWNQDEFSLGSYSHIPPGATGRDYRVLSKQSGDRLFWAGEATNRKYPQTVAGAYLSGQRAAQQIIALA
ncbi:MAG: FAD-dependent oxidoreductase [Chloroflexota bacterium]|nr:FAD-dependent oxidoreductase [Chloroflexota bacterium]